MCAGRTHLQDAQEVLSPEVLDAQRHRPRHLLEHLGLAGECIGVNLPAGIAEELLRQISRAQRPWALQEGNTPPCIHVRCLLGLGRLACSFARAILECNNLQRDRVRVRKCPPEAAKILFPTGWGLGLATPLPTPAGGLTTRLDDDGPGWLASSNDTGASAETCDVINNRDAGGETAAEKDCEKSLV